MKTLLTTLLLLLFSCQAFSQQDRLTLSSEWTDDRNMVINAQVNTPGAYSIAILFTHMENFSMPYTYFTSVSSSGQILRIKPTDPNKSISIAYRYIYVNGHAVSKVDDAFVYILPFDAHKRRTLRYVNKLNDKYVSEKTTDNWHYFSFDMEKDDTIRAIRKGTVIEIVDQHLPTEYKTHVSYTSQSNRMIVEHPDGTICEYAAIEKGSFMVKVGDVILPGDPIAKAGTYNGKNHELRISVYYQKINRKSSDLNEAFIKMSIDPLFATTRGDVKLINHEKYTAAPLSDQIKQKEMTKREIKSLSK